MSTFDFHRSGNGVTRIVKAEALTMTAMKYCFSQIWSDIRRTLNDENPAYVYAACYPESHFKSVVGVAAPVMYGCRDLVLGRHERCDIQLYRDDAVSLRHLLLRLTHTEEGRLVLRILDLKTSSGFVDHEGQSRRSLVSEDHARITVSGHFFFAVRNNRESWPESPEEAWNLLEPSVVPETHHPIEPWQAKVQIRPRIRLLAAEGDGTGLDLLPVEGTIRLHTVDPDAEDALGAINLDWPTGNGSARLRVRDLSRGLLLGRYPRCPIHDEEFQRCDQLSRVHLMLLLDENGLWAVDVASTNGTRCDGREFRTVKLGRQADLELADSVRVRWQAA